MIENLNNLKIKEIEENKYSITVPANVRYIGNWTNYSLNLFQFPHILDKKIPGCGYTEYCLTCDIPVILCSPRLMLLQNKYNQHKGELFYYRNEYIRELFVDKDITKDSKYSPKKELTEEEKKERDKKIKESIAKLNMDLDNYFHDCEFNKRVPKIIVTYDSFRILKEYLTYKNIIQEFHIVIDEFQSIFTDSRFKSNTELTFVNQLQNINKVCFVSATPMIDKYLKELDEFKDLPYYELDWESEQPGRVIKPDLKVRFTKSIISKAKEIINEYKSGNYEKFTYRDKNGNITTIESREAVFFVNSVKNITDIIKGCKLTPEECNILCSQSDLDNNSKIKKKLGKKFDIGSIPLPGEAHKMFTFCTRTVYLGADFYSTNARTFILSDANFETLAVDISLDLPQILGRQRLNENPWKNRAEFYYKSTKNKKSQKEFEEYIQYKMEKTKDLLQSYSETSTLSAKKTLTETFQRDTTCTNYKYNYVAVDKHSGEDIYPVFNKLVMISEKRAFEIQQVDYKDRFTVFNSIEQNNIVSESVSDNIHNFLTDFIDKKLFTEKMGMICTSNLTENELGVILDQIPLTYKKYYETLGPVRLKALGYNITLVDREYKATLFDKENLKQEVYKIYQEGSRYSRNSLKENLQKLYDSLNYNKKAKANDIEEYFEVKDCKVLNSETGKYEHGFELIKKKE
jgi:hypothetical protein